MSLWQFAAAMDGYNKAHDPKGEQSLSKDEQDALWDWVKE